MHLPPASYDIVISWYETRDISISSLGYDMNTKRLRLLDGNSRFQLIQCELATEWYFLLLPFMTLESTWMQTSQWLQLSQHALQCTDRYAESCRLQLVGLLQLTSVSVSAALQHHPRRRIKAGSSSWRWCWLQELVTMTTVHRCNLTSFKPWKFGNILL